MFNSLGRPQEQSKPNPAKIKLIIDIRLEITTIFIGNFSIS